MKKLLLIAICTNLCALLMLVGCASDGTPVERESLFSTPIIAPTHTVVWPTATETAFVTAITESIAVSMATSEPLVMPTRIPPTVTPPMPILLMANTATTPITCNQFQGSINIQQETNNQSWNLMDVTFPKNDEITFLMWSNRPYPEADPTPIRTPVSGGAVPPYLLDELNQSRRILLKGQIWNWEHGSLTETVVTNEPAMQTPCGEDCPVDVVSIAPNNSWQLLQITEAAAEYRGLWLVNEEDRFNVVPYVPIDSHWQWSNDSQLLWLIYTLQGINGETYGSESIVVDLTVAASPQIVFHSWKETDSLPNLLSPDEHRLVFSPLDKTVLVYNRVGSPNLAPADNQLDVYVMDVSQSPPKLLNTYKVGYPVWIDWSETLQDFVIMEASSEEAIIYTLNNDAIYKIPNGVFQGVNLDIGRRVIFAPDQKTILLVTSTNAWAYSCSD